MKMQDLFTENDHIMMDQEMLHKTVRTDVGQIIKKTGNLQRIYLTNLLVKTLQGKYVPVT